MNIAPSPTAVCGLVLAALIHLGELDLPTPTASAVLEATGVSRSTGYSARAQVQEALPSLLRPNGRPPRAQVEPFALVISEALHKQVLGFIFDHPGCVTGTVTRRKYSPGFRLFVLELCAQYSELPLEHLATACGVPLPTLKDWLRGDNAQLKWPVGTNLTGIKATEPNITQLETLLDAWARWSGGFRPFCDHVQFHLRLPYSRQLISDILESQGVRIPKRRRPEPDASALKEGFVTFFPGAQWVGDGSLLTVTVDGHPFNLNFELMVDTHTGAFVGASLRPTEDALAVTQALSDGLLTTGEAPNALLLDNKPSNHSAEVETALAGNSLLLRSRPFTPTDKPHVEGAFGLFAQHAPELRVDTSEPAALALQVATLVTTLWGRALNHLPRKGHGDLSRVELYADKPTEEEKLKAIQALKDRLLKQKRAAETRAKRQDPLVRQTVLEALDRLGLEDPKGHFLTAIASWPLDAILAGIAVFEAKQGCGSLPEGADVRYLRGIIKNIAHQDEGMAFASLLLQARIEARDRALGPLEVRKERLDEDSEDLSELLVDYIDSAILAARRFDRLFWLLNAVDIISQQPEHNRKALLKVAARRIHATSSEPYKERLAATRFLFARILPID